MSGKMKLICPSGETGQKISSKVHFPLFLIMVQLINVFRHCTYTVYLFNTMGVTTRKGVRVTAFNATFNNISVISWRSALLVEETGGPGENYRPVTCH